MVSTWCFTVWYTALCRAPSDATEIVQYNVNNFVTTQPTLMVRVSGIHLPIYILFPAMKLNFDSLDFKYYSMVETSVT
jgi:hypothetical protein